jgi:galactokinase
MGVRAWAPGRVNLIGDHTDYTGGLVLPMAIPMGVEVTGDRGGSWVMLGSNQLPGMAEIELTVDDPAGVELPWARYVAAVIAEIKPTDGIIGTVTSNLPIGLGLSSSAALEVAVAVALGAHIDDPVTVAQACQQAEYRAVGVPCGIMDPLTSLAGVDNSALRIDCGALEFEPVPLPDDVEVVIVDSGQHRELAQTPYSLRREESARVEALVGSLRELSEQDVDGIEDPVLQRRARHIVAENQRVEAMVAAFRDHDLRTAGDLMAASHASLRDNYEVSTPQLDELAHALRSTAGVYGARMTGGGFGGSVVALCDPYCVFDIPIIWRGRPAGGATLTID